MSVPSYTTFLGASLVSTWILTLTLVAGAQVSGPGPISIVSNTSMNFGAIYSGPAGGSVTVTPAGRRSAMGGVSLASAALVSAGAFTVSGHPNAVYSIVLPSSVSIGQGARSMTLVNFVSEPSGIGTLDFRGEQILRVGATLHISTGRVTSPSVPFHVTVTYD